MRYEYMILKRAKILTASTYEFFILISTVDVNTSAGCKRKLNTLPLADKVRLISVIDKGLTKKIAAEFGLPSNTLSTIKKKNCEAIAKKPQMVYLPAANVLKTVLMFLMILMKLFSDGFKWFGIELYQFPGR